jgi:hypothetical protein
MEEELDDVRGGGRGPAYPYIPLSKAIERIEVIREANMARVPVAPLAYYKAWGFAGENGNARQTLAALNHFGLVEYVGRGKDRQIKLSPLALRVVFDRVPDSPERAQAIREAALMPSVYQKLWGRFGHELPPDYALETFLMRDCGFNDVGAKKTIGGYRDTFEFARLSEPSNMPSEERTEAPSEAPSPRNDERAKPEHRDRPKTREAKAGMNEDVFTLKEGDAVFQWPQTLSPESYQDLEDWTRLLLRKIKRHVEIAAKFDNLDEQEGAETGNG